VGGHLLDIELALPLGFVLLAAAGLVYAAFAAYLYLRLNKAPPTSPSLLLFLLWPGITSSSSVHTPRRAFVLVHITAISDGPRSGNYDLARIASSV
jgi:hypothetical protein